MINLRMIDYSGDFDTLNEVYLIGPYNSKYAAEADAKRLALLPDVDGLMKFELTDLSAPEMAHPNNFINVNNLEEIQEAYWSSF